MCGLFSTFYMRILIQSWTYFRKLGKATFISVIMQPAKNWGDLVVRGLLEIPCSLDTGKLWKVAQKPGSFPEE